MTTYTLQRSGDVPLRFVGEELFSGDTHSVSGPGQNRWHTLHLYQSDAGLLVASVTFHSSWQGEPGETRSVYTSETPAELAAALRGHDPIPPRVGFPPRADTVERQANLVTLLTSQWRELLSAALSRDEFVADLQADHSLKKERYYYRSILDRTRRELAAIFSRAEICAVMDALNGTMLLIESDFDGWAFIGAELEDAIRLNALDEKWSIEANGFLRRLNTLTAAQKFALAEAAEQFWERCGEETDDVLRDLGLLK